MREVNYKFKKETLESIKKNNHIIKRTTGMSNLIDNLMYIIEDFEEEVKIETFSDINDYVEYFIEMSREV